ncbi:MAG TPA: hypothetical protein VLA21_11585, partial [Candidatus Limnocylindria bacterium]|nr:hypothetical protein [Candidatus Limnocylindria bacterium]
GEALLEYELSGAQGNLVYDAARARSVRTQPAPAPGFPFLPEFMGTAMCPIAAALRDLPKRLEAQGHGMAEEGMRMADILRRAFSEARVYRA